MSLVWLWFNHQNWHKKRSPNRPWHDII